MAKSQMRVVMDKLSSSATLIAHINVDMATMHLGEGGGGGRKNLQS